MNEQPDVPPRLSRRHLISGMGAIAAVGAIGGVLAEPTTASAATTWWFPMTTRPGVTSGYGMRKDPVTGEYTLHDGVDYGITPGTPVYAMRSGTVAFAGTQGGYGNYVTVQHADGYLTGYGHLSRVAATAGRAVQAGTLIGYSGNTGWSTGPHLHVLMHLNGSPYNPTSILNAAPLATGGTAPTNPSEPKDEDMVLIQSPNRGVAAVGAGYFRALPTAEFIGAAQVLFGDPVIGNDRQFDVWKANAVQGQTVRF